MTQDQKIDSFMLGVLLTTAFLGFLFMAFEPHPIAGTECQLVNVVARPFSFRSFKPAKREWRVFCESTRLSEKHNETKQ